jgi:hypothetical protein
LRLASHIFHVSHHLIEAFSLLSKLGSVMETRKVADVVREKIR